MRVLSFVTESHEDMLSRFVVDRLELAGFTNDDTLQIVFGAQVCESGVYGSDGFTDCMLDKLTALAGVPIGETCFYVDADVILMPGCKQLLEFQEMPENSIACQWDDGQLCLGMVYWTQTRATRKWWRFVRDFAKLRGMIDQHAMHALLLNCNSPPIRTMALPLKAFGNWSHVRPDRRLWAGDPFNMPEICVAWHANFTMGLANKWKMLEQVEKNTCQVQVVC